ncbi:GNAT family N-acetyltransferase [Streptomyces sp. So13.3]|uniref:GNAT family N-acetyltransferase n=1 Tax=Streptomyces TaxID=1883 RepID=UPI0011071924|nr:MULTISPECIES: GNAT family N-acetyltransferase [Streptomyces]MCZ4098551.1 GNAT family N-acetyltransferase [Streptomyces sp. H39-C1]QNA77454.1 GNAT family N-acetyltransferase [Streptomyces sp. So13.3]
MSTPLGVTLRPYTPADQTAVLHLINADRLPGQPPTTPAMLHQALEGRSPVDAQWWAALDQPTTEVVVEDTGAVFGVVSYAVRPKDDTGVILWLHCGEAARTADLLIRRAVAALAPRPVQAFQIASALSLGLEALPVRNRAVTDEALRRAGFTGERLWRYLRAALPTPGLPHAAHVHIGRADDTGKNTRRLEIRNGPDVVAEAVVGPPVHGIGVLWRIEVAPSARGQGLGRALLGSALDVLTGLGATEVILYVDDDAPAGDDRDRTATNRLYDSAGFIEIDQLHSYTLARTGHPR